MQNLDIREITQKIKKTKEEVKKELEELIAKNRWNKNVDMQEKVNGCKTNEDAVKAIQEFEQIIQNKKNDIVWLAYCQGQILQKFKEKEQFVSDMALKSGVNKSTIMFKIALKKLIDDSPKIKISSLSLHYFLKNLKLIKEICKENASEFK